MNPYGWELRLRARWRDAWRLLAAVAVLAVGVPASAAAEDDATSPQAVSLSVEPAEIVLGGGNRGQTVLVTASAADGQPFDVTHDCELNVLDAAVARIDGGAVWGVADGATSLTVARDGLEVRVPIRVAGQATYPPVDFGNDVVPLFSKLGCNNGGCHGKASGGQNGFKLSVFGFDPAADYDALVKEARGRRVFPAVPEQSLLVAKPAGTTPHGGGQRLSPASPDYRLLVEWIRQGLPRAQPHAPRLTALRASPTERVLRFGTRQQILATAIYSDGTTRDVTAAAGYASNAPPVVEAEAGGLVRAGNSPGEAAITVHYMGQVAAVQLALPRPADGAVFPEVEHVHPVDRLVWEKLRRMNVVPSGLCDDATFLRRASLDVLGALPTPDEARAFAADSAADKRARLVDRLLARDDYADYWALFWSDILLVDRQKLGERGAYELHRWLRRQLAENRPYDAWVRELVTASGNSATNGPANFFRALDTPDDAARTVSQAFLGVRLECAQCHHHPFEKWSQEDFYGLAGFFNGLERKPLGPARVMVYHAGYRETRIPNREQVAAMRPPDGEPAATIAAGDPRVELAAWLTAAENPWFARLAVNRVWKHYLGRGLVEPEDDLRSTNPATNPPLLDFLSERFTAGGYDLRALQRTILTSRTYQLSAETNATNRDDAQNYSHHYPRRLPAEVMLDAICRATGSAEEFYGLPRGTRAVELWDNRLPSYFLEIFGRPARTSPCECGRTSDPTMAQALHLMNAPEIETKIADPGGRAARLAESSASEVEIVDELCLAVLARLPSERERAIAAELFAVGDRRQAAEDFLWTLLNSYDFLFVQ